MNLHATACLAGSAGVLVTGSSGSGKTSVALALIDRCRLEGRAAFLVADDQVLLEPAGARLVVRVPAPIAGLVEIRGHGPVPIPHEPAAVIDLVVRLVDGEGERMPEPRMTRIAGVELPLLELPARRSGAAAAAILAKLAEFGSLFGGK